MDRVKCLEEAAREYLKIRFEESEKLIREEYLIHESEIYQNLTDVISGGLMRCMQITKKVKYVVVSTLESSNITQSYELQIAFFNEKMYADDTPVYTYWKPMYIFSKVEEDICFAKEKMSEKIIRIKDYEMAPIKKEYLLNHYFLALLFLRQLLPDVLERSEELYSCLEPEATVLWGRYMEKNILVYQMGEKK